MKTALQNSMHRSPEIVNLYGDCRALFVTSWPSL